MGSNIEEVFLKTHPDFADSVLLSLQSLCPFRYAQWVREDPLDCEYRVISAIVPDGAEGYATAHRSGIIGQVFRSQKSILARDVHNHPMYDPFDNSIDWEFCFPVSSEGTVQAAINLEGGGALKLDQALWSKISHIIEEITGCQAPASLPENDTCHLTTTRRFIVNVALAENECSAMLEMARAIARGGKSTLLVGHYPDLLCGRGPTMAEASEQGLPASYCFFGVEKRLDLLATGPGSDEVLRKHEDWWDHCAGRYEFVLLHDR